MANLILNHPQTVLVIGDSHATVEHNNDRFTWLGRMIADRKPSCVWNIGDLADHISLLTHGKNIEKEGKRYQADCDAAYDAQERIFHEVRKTKKKQPTWKWSLGNHDVRPERFVQDNPMFEGKIRNEDIGYKDFPWEVYPFLDVTEYQGIMFSHYFTSGIMNKPIGGIHPAWSIIKKLNNSAVCGHSHVLDYKIDKTPGRSLMGLVTGNFIDHDMDYAGPANNMWSRGVSYLTNVENGLYDFEWVSMNRIRKEYGNG